MINQYIPLYDLLTDDEKIEFERTDDGQQLLDRLQQGTQSRQPFRPHDTYASRAHVNIQRAQEIRNYITDIAQRSSAFKRLKAQIIVKFFPEIKFTDDELNFLVSRNYSTLLLNHAVSPGREAWVARFCADESPEAQGIKRDVFEHYDAHFGFLFKRTRNLRELLAIIHALSFKPKARQIKFIQQEIRSEWPNPSSYTERLFARVEESLGFLLKHPANITQKYVNDIANAHTVYRFLGLSSENMVLGIGFEGVPRPYANLLDLYNYHQNRIAIAEGLGILQTLSIPFRLFFSEYADIARVEENPLSICVRAFIPFFVMGVILSCAYTILLPLAAHAFLEYLLFIPTLYLSIAAAGVYIQYKNSMYTAMLEWWYGSLYMAPQFHANQRIQSAFSNDEELSTQVAKYYANSLEACDRIEQWYAERHTHLKDEEILARKINLKLKFDLYMEWYDLHDRQDLGIDRIPDIVLGRLHSDNKRLRGKIKNYSERWCECLYTKQSFFENPTFREKFHELKQGLFAIEALEFKLNNYIDDLSSTQHQVCELNNLC